MAQLTPEDIRQARAILDHRVRWQDDGEYGERALVIRVLDNLIEERDRFRDAAVMYAARVAELNAKLAVTEQQPDPVSPDEVTAALRTAWQENGGNWVRAVADFLDGHTVTRKAGA